MPRLVGTVIHSINYLDKFVYLTNGHSVTGSFCGPANRTQSALSQGKVNQKNPIAIRGEIVYIPPTLTEQDEPDHGCRLCPRGIRSQSSTEYPVLWTGMNAERGQVSMTE
jgi:hypothetical protein